MSKIEIDILSLMQDNYCYVIQKGDKAAIIDPGTCHPILEFLEINGLYPVRILLTHDHADHNGGVSGILHEYPDAEIIGPGSFEGDVVFDLFKEGGDEIAAFQTPGHTDHGMCYYFPSEKVVFTGDTLFTGGCGKVLGGNCEDLFESVKRLAELPDEIRVLPGHEYLEDNVQFIRSLNLPTAFYDELIEKKDRPSIESTIGDEKKNNPFMRCDDPIFGEWIGYKSDPAKVFCELRKRKNAF